MAQAQMAAQGQSAVNGSEKAALLLLMLGEEHASKVLQHLPANQVERIGTAMAGIGRVDNQRAQTVMKDFRDAIQTETSLGVGVQGYLRRLLTGALGEQSGATLADRVLGAEENRDMESLRWLEPEALVGILKDEHPQIIAITLAHLEKEQAAKVLKLFPNEQQENIVYRIANMKTIPEAAMSQLQKMLQKKLSVSTSFKSRNVDGAATVADIINGLDAETETRILERLAQDDEALSTRIQELMFVFSNLLGISDRGIQVLLREVSSDKLPVALKGADPEVKEKIMGNMSKRAREMLEEDMETRGPVKISEVEEAQREILETAKKLAEAGQIDLGKGGDEYL